MAIYTKGGDKGKTSLVGGTRISKGDLRIELYGSVDELNSFLGHVMVLQEKIAAEDFALLERLQQALFSLGALMACEADKRDKFKLTPIPIELIDEMEQAIDRIEKKVGPLKKFIMPRGSELVTRLHLARTVARRVERLLVRFEMQYADQEIPLANCFLNRLSDYLFMLVRDQLLLETNVTT